MNREGREGGEAAAEARAEKEVPNLVVHEQGRENTENERADDVDDQRRPDVGKELPQTVAAERAQPSADGNRAYRSRQFQITHALASPERAYVPERAFGGRGMK